MKMIIPLILICLAASPALADKLSGKKLIEYGWDRPGTAYVREHITEMEKAPFDGVVICVAHKTVSSKKIGGPFLGHEIFTRKKLQPAEYEHAIIDLKATKFQRFTDNFIQLLALPGDIDWFDPEWGSVAHNAAAFARIAKLGGCKGIMFDPEIYSHPFWTYKNFTDEKKAAHSFQDYEKIVRQRGREFIRAINKEFPDITLLCLYGYCLPYVESVFIGGGKLDNTNYALLPAFYDGICDAATPGTVLIDGHEYSYGYKTRKEFDEGYSRVFESLEVAANPKVARKHLKAGHGIWADNNSGEIGWHPEDFSKNYFTPQQLRTSLNLALESTDKYVWIYSQRINWWDGTAPKEFVDALRLCKEGPSQPEAEK